MTIVGIDTYRNYIMQLIYYIIILLNHYTKLNFVRCHELRTASNRLLISLLLADFIFLFQCYLNVIQGLKGVPIFGIYGKKKLVSSVITLNIMLYCNTKQKVIHTLILIILYNPKGARYMGSMHQPLL